jgi:hypothetical protein
MIFQVVLDANIKKQLKALRKEGGRAGLIADHAESVIKKLALAEEVDLKQLVRLTKRGEARIKSSMKFDLLHGYRLIALRQGHDLVFVYVGSHDECDRWLKNNSGLRSVPQRSCDETESLEVIVPPAPVEEEEPESDVDAYEDYLSAVLDEKTLRKVFRGLTGG